LAACGRTERSGDEAPSGNGAAIDAGSASAAKLESPCDDERAFAIWGKRYDPERDCIDTEVALEDVACTIQPAPDASVEEHYFSDGFSCVRRLSDGERYWVFAFNQLGFDPNVWERCADEPVLAPKGCHAAGCTEAPRSSCSLAETQKWFDCSATGEYDENCCGRQPCEDSGDCRSDEECRSVPSSGQMWCWDSSESQCDCGGPHGGPNKQLCVPEEQGGAEP
jgi:hypothetical protein